MTFENEGSLNSDVGSEVSSEPQSEGNQQQPASGENQSQVKQEQTPFHEHPRFKELIEEKNAYAEQVRTFERQLQQLQSQVQKQQMTPAQEDKLIARLKQIDPEFGERFAEIDRASREKVSQMEQQLQAMQQERNRSSAQTQLSQLYTENKVAKEWQNLYSARLREIGNENPHLKLADLPKVFKQVHAEIGKLVDTTRRSDREQYVSDKTKSSQAPSPGKGTAPKPQGSKSEWSKDPYEARKQLVDKLVAGMRNGKEI